MKKETLVKALVIVIVPGGIPIYLGYMAYQLGKKAYDKQKKVNKEKNKESAWVR